MLKWKSAMNTNSKVHEHLFLGMALETSFTYRMSMKTNLKNTKNISNFELM